MNDPSDRVVGLAVLVDCLDRVAAVGLRLRDGRATVVFDEAVTDSAASRDVKYTVFCSVLAIERNFYGQRLVCCSRRPADIRWGAPGAYLDRCHRCSRSAGSPRGRRWLGSPWGERKRSQSSSRHRS